MTPNGYGKQQRTTPINPGPFAIGQRVRARRMEIGMTQAALAEATGLAKGSIAHVEQANGGRYPSGHTIATLSRALDTSMDYLWFGDAQ